MAVSIPYTTIPGMIAPAFPGPEASRLLALQFQLSQSQFWPATAIESVQRVQLSELLRHAWKEIPFYRERLQATGWNPRDWIEFEQFRQLPLLTRDQAVDAGESLLSANLPEGHGKVHCRSTSGSTGKPLTAWNTEVSQQLHYALHLRYFLWHRRDFSRDVATIRSDAKQHAPAPDGKTFTNWGPWLKPIFATGKSHFLSAASGIAEQLDWLQRRRAPYLYTFPSNLAALLDAVEEQDTDLGFLEGIGTLGEAVSGELRERVRERFGWGLSDVYSSNEMGYMAMQCPQHDHYHVTSENVYLEVLDEQGRPCKPGQVGRVVVTGLCNFAAPLIRYEIGDYAEVGEACDCGRQLPVIKRFIGRVRNMLKHPDGSIVFPYFSARGLKRFAPIRQFQLQQTGAQNLLLKLVVSSRPGSQAEAGMRQLLQDHLNYPFVIDIEYVEQIERSASGKFEDFMCLI